MKQKVLLACAGLLWAASSLTFADHRPGAFSVGLADGAYLFAQKRHLQNNSIPTLELGYDFSKEWGVKAAAGVLNTNTKGAGTSTGAHGVVYGLDGVYRFNHEGNFVPYALAGLGVISLKPSGMNTNDQANANVGIGAQYFIDDSIAFGAEGKDLYTFSGGKNDLMFTLGITFLIGGSTPETVHYKDEDYKGQMQKNRGATVRERHRR